MEKAPKYTTNYAKISCQVVTKWQGRQGRKGTITMDGTGAKKSAQKGHYLMYPKRFPKKFFCPKKFSITCFKRGTKKVQEKMPKIVLRKVHKKSLVPFKVPKIVPKRVPFSQKSSQFSALKSVPKKCSKKVQNRVL